MAYFNPTKQTEVPVDASPVGVGVILAQEGKIIAYTSRVLTDVEQRYSQTDREMLAVVFSVKCFHLYLYGSNFAVYTDHKPLLGIYKRQKSVTTHTERWCLWLIPYDMTLKYRPGRNDLNPTDYVSHQPQDVPKCKNAAYVNNICKKAVPKSMTLEEVHKEIQKDSMMRKLAKAIQTGQWMKDLTDYIRFKDELSVSCGVILRDHRLIIPDSLRKKVTEIAHASHQAIVKTKQLIREKIWFPGIDKKVEQAAKSCILYLACIPSPAQHEPLSTGTAKHSSCNQCIDTWQ